jgi:hypothetical protein
MKYKKNRTGEVQWPSDNEIKTGMQWVVLREWSYDWEGNIATQKTICPSASDSHKFIAE